METNIESKKGLSQLKWKWQRMVGLFSKNGIKQSYMESGKIFSDLGVKKRTPNGLEDYFKSSIDKAQRIKFYH